MSKGFNVTGMHEVANWSPLAREAIRKALGECDSVPPPKGSGYKMLSAVERNENKAMLPEMQVKFAGAEPPPPPQISPIIRGLAWLVFQLRRKK